MVDKINVGTRTLCYAGILAGVIVKKENELFIPGEDAHCCTPCHSKLGSSILFYFILKPQWQIENKDKYIEINK